MTKKARLDWEPDTSFATGKGADVQRFTAKSGTADLENDTTPWGEGDLKLNGKEVAHVSDDADGGDAFRELEAIAEELEERKAEKTVLQKDKSPSSKT